MTNQKYQTISNLSENTVLLKNVLDISLKGLQIVDKEGYIIYVNDSYEKIHNVKAEDVIGKHVTDVIENTRLHLVAKTGIAERDELQMIHGHEFVVSRIPIFDDNKECIGVIGVIRFEYTEQIKNLTKKLEKLENELKTVNESSTQNSDTNFAFNDIIAVSEVSRNAKEIALRAASSESTVLLLGESGVGKEVYAHAIHNLSRRNKGPFIRMNCSAIQETLFESELFGYEEGAFTGAKKGGKKGNSNLPKGALFSLMKLAKCLFMFRQNFYELFRKEKLNE